MMRRFGRGADVTLVRQAVHSALQSVDVITPGKGEERR